MQSCVHQLADHEVEDSLLAELALPKPAVDTVELEDARWFHLTWLERQLSKSGVLHAFIALFVYCDPNCCRREGLLSQYRFSGP